VLPVFLHFRRKFFEIYFSNMSVPAMFGGYSEREPRGKGVQSMSANERRTEIIRILLGRRRDTIPQLAAELQVSRSTVNRDILALTEEYPLETVQGNGGGVGLPDWYRPNKNLLTRNQQDALTRLIESDSPESVALQEILVAFGAQKATRR
jgi:biotin operon repressor